MGKRRLRTQKSPGATEQQDPMEEKFFFQQLPPDIQMVVLQGVKFRLARVPRAEDLGLFDLDDLLDEEADDLINRNNITRTITDWLAFAKQSG